jgi:hypothetical protein
LQHKDVTAVMWQDKRVVLLLSTNSDPRTDGSVTRKTEKGNEEMEHLQPTKYIPTKQQTLPARTKHYPQHPT